MNMRDGQGELPRAAYGIKDDNEVRIKSESLKLQARLNMKYVWDIMDIILTLMKYFIFWDITPCKVVESQPTFRRNMPLC
jgi:hypothetical protein